MSGLPAEAPVACTLGSTELGAQVERWRKLYAAAGTERAARHDGLRLRFRREPSVERALHDLVAVEIECCEWARWTIETKPGELVLEISSTGHGVPVIQSWSLGADPCD